MSLSKLKSGNSDQFHNGSSVSVACRVCGRVFPDNVSLLSHFESHGNDGSRLRGRDPASSRSGQKSSSSWSPHSHSSSVRTHEAYDVNEYVRFHSFLAKIACRNRKAPKIRVMNAMPSLSPSSDNDENVPIRHLEKKPNQETFTLSDGEDAKSAADIDLKLKL